MAYDAPSSEIYLIKNCPLDIGREHTIKFATPSAQFSYFTDPSRALHFFGQYTRINPLDNTIRVGLPYARVYECNYVAFNNASLLQEQKWYYGFITKVNYINEGTTEIEYSLDYMQTYLFDFEVLPCLVEREHTATDNVGDNIVPEGLDIGEYVFNNSVYSGNQLLNPNGYIPCEMGTEIVYLMISSIDVIETAKAGYAKRDISDFYPVGGVFNGVGVYVFVTVEDLGRYLSFTEGLSDSVAAICPFPAALISWDCVHFEPSPSSHHTNGIGRLYDDNGHTSVIERDLSSNVSFSYTIVNPNTHQTETRTVIVRSGFNIPLFRGNLIDNYRPWNNKLYTAPFCWVCVDTKTGEQQLYRPELFSTRINFGFVTAPSADPKILAYPLYYRGTDKNYEEGITKNNAYPYCAWTYDNFKTWIAQNSANLALSFATSMASGTLGMMSTAVGRSSSATGTKHSYGVMPLVNQERDKKGRWTKNFTKGTATVDFMEDMTRDVAYKNNKFDVALSGLTGYAGALNAVASVIDHSWVPDSVKGQINNGDINQSNDMNDFYIYIKTLRRDYVIKIDEFLSRYGYAVNKFEVPNLFAQNGSPRRRWNYVKTADAKIHSKTTTGFPLDVEQNLEQLFNNGVTFWNIENGDMYDYSQTANNNNKPN